MSTTPVVFDRKLFMIFGITLMVVMGVSSVMPVLPLIARTFDLSPASVGLAITSFTLPGIVLAPIGGVLADRLGRKRVLVPALILFALGGSLCALATTLPQLLFCRFVQGIGAAPLGVLYTTLIGDLYDGNARIRAMGFNAAALSLGTAIYPALGGIMGELGWNVPFLLPLLALPLCILVIRTPLPEPMERTSMRVYLKATARIAFSGAAFTLFGLTLLTFTLLYGPMVTYFPLLADTQFSASPSTIGFIFAAASAGTMITASRLGSLAETIHPRHLIMASCVAYAIAMLLMPTVTSLWWLMGPVFIYGLGQGLNFPNLTVLLTGLAPTEGRAAIMAINGTVLRLAQTIAPPLFGLLFSQWGMPGVYTGGAIVACCMFVLTLLRLR